MAWHQSLSYRQIPKMTSKIATQWPRLKLTSIEYLLTPSLLA
ncbi:hypothetical protein SLEP1_g10636 [Rubroshorea leprosula]|uniref:Uncharacterized protein n=1 Tax=Rubroshorea leprosula TaxID=152421 RepID=A0AAV5I8N9_9ROSI|nr:hypothetical protein SLEP1_g10636 [Rubroshorea leprosula]